MSLFRAYSTLFYFVLVCFTLFHLVLAFRISSLALGVSGTPCRSSPWTYSAAIPPEIGGFSSASEETHIKASESFQQSAPGPFKEFSPSGLTLGL